MRLILSGRDATTITFDYVEYATANLAGFDVQYATRRDFQFCIAPIASTGIVSGVLGGLNRAQTYWIRGREYYADGSRARWSPPLAITTEQGIGPPDDLAVQIQNAYFVPPEPILVSVNGGLPGYPAANLTSPSPVAQTWFADAAAKRIYVETSGGPVDTIALLETNIPDGATVAILHGPTAESVRTGPPAYQVDHGAFRCSPGLTGRRGYHGLWRLAAPTTNRFFRIDISGTAPAYHLVVATHLVMGLAREAKGYSDMTDQVVDYSSLDRLRDGTPDAVAGFRARRVDFSLAFMEKRMHERLFADLGQRVGLSEPMLIVPNSKPGRYFHDQLLYGNLTLSRQTNSNARFTRSLSVDSIINP